MVFVEVIEDEDEFLATPLVLRFGADILCVLGGVKDFRDNIGMEEVFLDMSSGGGVVLYLGGVSGGGVDWLRSEIK